MAGLSLGSSSSPDEDSHDEAHPMEEGATMTPSPPAGHVTVPCAFCSRMNRVEVARIPDRPRCGECGKPILLDRPVRVTDESFDGVVGNSDIPVLVDFYADWCAPCKVIAPQLEDLARIHTGKALVAKLDTDRNPGTAQRFRIGGIPTLVVFRGGSEVGREVGAVPRQTLEALFERGFAAAS
jgi:thioredoxin 2